MHAIRALNAFLVTVLLLHLKEPKCTDLSVSSWKTTQCSVFANQPYFHSDTDNLLRAYLASNRSCFWDSPPTEDMDVTNLLSTTANDQCQLHYNSADTVASSVKYKFLF